MENQIILYQQQYQQQYLNQQYQQQYQLFLEQIKQEIKKKIQDCLAHLYKANQDDIIQIRNTQKHYKEPTISVVEDIFVKWGCKAGFNGNSNEQKIKKIMAFEIIYQYYKYPQIVFDLLLPICSLKQFYDYRTVLSNYSNSNSNSNLNNYDIIMDVE